MGEMADYEIEQMERGSTYMYNIKKRDIEAVDSIVIMYSSFEGSLKFICDMDKNECRDVLTKNGIEYKKSQRVEELRGLISGAYTES